MTRRSHSRRRVCSPHSSAYRVVQAAAPAAAPVPRSASGVSYASLRPCPWPHSPPAPRGAPRPGLLQARGARDRGGSRYGRRTGNNHRSGMRPSIPPGCERPRGGQGRGARAPGPCPRTTTIRCGSALAIVESAEGRAPAQPSARPRASVMCATRKEAHRHPRVPMTGRRLGFGRLASTGTSAPMLRTTTRSIGAGRNPSGMPAQYLTPMGGGR